MSLAHLLLPVLLLAAGASAAHNPDFCRLTTKNDPLPAGPKVFTMTVTSKADNSTTLLTMMEYYDNNQKLSSFFVRLQEKSFRVVLDHGPNKEALIVDRSSRRIPGNCHVQKFACGNLLVSVDLPGFKQFLMPSMLLHFDSSSRGGTEDQGTERIDGGLEARKFYSCYYAQNIDVSMRITWYFLKYGTNDVTPYRIRMEGFDNKDGKHFNETLDISNYRNNPPGWTAMTNPFMAPPGVYCMGKISSRPVPRLPDRFTIRSEEVMDNVTEPVSLMEAYDFNAGLSQMERHPPPFDRSPRFGPGKLLFMRDFNAGRRGYVINLDQGNCTFVALRGDDWDSRGTATRVRMRNPKEFFDLDWEHVQYKGSGFVRGIPADVFIGFKTLRFGGGIEANTTVEWYLIEKTVHNVTINGPQKVVVPIAIRTTSFQAPWLNSWSYFYDFETKDLRFHRHELTYCFSQEQKLHFIVYFPLPNEAAVRMVQERPRDLMYLAVPLIARGLGISPLRVVDPEVMVSSTRKTALLEVTITDRGAGSDSAVTIDMVDSRLRKLVSDGDVFAITNDANGELLVLRATRITNIEKRLRSMGSINVGYSAGDMAGAAIGLMLAGIVAGLLAAFFYFR